MEENPASLDRIVHVDCNACGSMMTYDPGKQMLACGHCGNTQALPTDADQLVERSFDEAMDLSTQKTGFDQPVKVFHCNGCGANTAVEPSQTRFICPFCSSENVNAEAHDSKMIRPAGVLPFKIPKDAASGKFKEWIKKGFFAPNNLKRLAKLDGLRSVYLPFWTYDAATDSDWHADAGYYYYETEYYQDKDGNTQERRVRHTRWVPVSGFYGHHFDDVLILGSHGITQQFCERIYPFGLDDVVNYDGRYLLGHDSEVYQRDVQEGFGVASEIMDEEIRSAIVSTIPGDTYRDLRVNTHKHDITFKHILLPIWIAAYRYNGKLYQFMVNGQTGKISGKKPVSGWKVAALVVAILGAAAAAYFAFAGD
jgi:DNA-directed RNA polymerase subunit M/transcription elongation factor TFIIS